MSSKQILEYEGSSSVNIWKKKKTFQVEGTIKANILRQGTARRPVENKTLIEIKTAEDIYK